MNVCSFEASRVWDRDPPSIGPPGPTNLEPVAPEALSSGEAPPREIFECVLAPAAIRIPMGTNHGRRSPPHPTLPPMASHKLVGCWAATTPAAKEAGKEQTKKAKLSTSYLDHNHSN